MKYKEEIFKVTKYGFFAGRVFPFCIKFFPKVNMLEKLTVFSILFVGTVTGAVQGPIHVKSWIWGEDVPALISDDSDKISSPSDYPDHGFIELVISEPESAILISLVKRPPAAYFPEDEKFCTHMLPAALADMVEETFMTNIQSISVYLDADPYRPACKCYMRTFIRMGLNRIGQGSGIIVNEGDVESFCDYSHDAIIGRPAIQGGSGHVPSGVSEEDRRKLSETVSFILHDQSPASYTETKSIYNF
jgi:hypothetical protein